MSKPKEKFEEKIQTDEFKPLGYALIDTIGEFLNHRAPTHRQSLIIIASLEGVKQSIAKAAGIVIDKIETPDDH